jgi:tRNA-specific 2-thiouridylase
MSSPTSSTGSGDGLRVLVAMSGGVDSSVAAALMRQAGHDVMGVTLKLWSGPRGEAPTAGCCTVSDAEDARRVAAQLDIPYYVLDHTDDFKDGVVDRFVSDYVSGRTPNPCIECNRTVKFDRLLARLDDFECDVLVTGHHARSREVAGTWHLLRGRDEAKDQSYVLSMLTQAELARTRFPVGELTKAEVRDLAAGMGMRTAHKPESMDICFVGQRDYRGFLRDVAPEAFTPGRMVDLAGDEVGSHEGIVGFTVGQRRGLGMATGEPRFVIRIEPSTATVVVGSREDLGVGGVTLDQLTWTAGSSSDGAVMAQYRAHGDPVPASIRGARLEFAEPQSAVAPGQTVAFYDDERVLGGALIASTA